MIYTYWIKLELHIVKIFLWLNIIDTLSLVTAH